MRLLLIFVTWRGNGAVYLGPGIRGTGPGVMVNVSEDGRAACTPNPPRFGSRGTRPRGHPRGRAAEDPVDPDLRSEPGAERRPHGVHRAGPGRAEGPGHHLLSRI